MIPPIMAQTGGNSVVFVTSLSRRLSGTWDSLTDYLTPKPNSEECSPKCHIIYIYN